MKLPRHFTFRAHHGGELIPGKVLTRQGKIHVSYNGQEIPLTNFEVLMNSGGFTWQESSNGHVPPHAVPGGNSSTGETLYIGRARHHGRIIPGKVHPSHQCLYYPNDWKENLSKTYEVLVKLPGGGGGGWNYGGVPVFPPGVSNPMSGGLQWQHWSSGRPWPTNAVQGGVYKEGGTRNPQYIARRRHQASTMLGYAYMNGPFYAGFHGSEVTYGDFEVLVDNVGAFPRENL